MRIMFYIHSLSSGGAERLVVNTLRKLAQRGNDVCLLVGNREDNFLETELEAAGIAITSLNNNRFEGFGSRYLNWADRALFASKKLNQAINDFRPDIFHMHSIPPGLERCTLLPKFMGFTFHTSVDRGIRYLGERNNRLLHSLVREGMTLFAISRKVEEDLKREFATESVVYAPNAVDFLEISKISDREGFRKSLGIAGDAYLVGHIGRMHPVKNHEKVLRVFSSIADKNTNARFVLVGGGDSARLTELQALAGQLLIDDKILFMGERDDAIGIMSAMDAIILPSHVEGLPMVMIEAQALGVRFVGTSAISREAFCLSNCISLDTNADDSVWASAALGEMSNTDVHDLRTYDLNNSIDALLFEYETMIANG